MFPLKVRAELPPSEEDWESEATVTRSYDPRAKAEKMQVGWDIVKTCYVRTLKALCVMNNE